MTETTNPALALAAINDDSPSARWNFPAAIGSFDSAPAGIGTAVSLSYSFLASVPAYDTPQTGFQALNTTQQDAVRAALAQIAEVTGVSFTEVAAADGTLAFGGNDQSAAQAAYAYFPYYDYVTDGNGQILSVSEDALAGTVWLNTDYANDPANPGSEGYVTLLHEIGHALGLKHPFEAGPGGYTLGTALDTEAYTVMSYSVAPRTTIYEISGDAQSYSYTLLNLSPTSLMSYDIAALQYLYGSNQGTRSGNTVYSWALNEELFETLWDAGGIDTIDCSNQTLVCQIDLTTGAFSSIGLRQTDAEMRAALDLPDWFTQNLDPDTYNGSRNLCIAYNCAVENATGGSAGDRLQGNALANVLLGGAGADTLLGAAGADSLNGGSGNDSLNGGDGADIYVVDASGDVVAESNSSLSLGGSDLVNSSVSFVLGNNLERLTLSGSAAINGTGNALGNLLTGNSGANLIKGLAGLDSLAGGSGNDQLFGGLGNDTLTGGLGNDRFVFDAIKGSTNIDRITDFRSGTDKIVLDDDIFTRLPGSLTTKTLAAADLKLITSGTGFAAGDASDRIIYNTTTDKLYYDADGTGRSAAVQIATVVLTGTAHPVAKDFLLVV